MKINEIHHSVNETCKLLSYMTTEPIEGFSLTTSMKMKLADVMHMCQHFYFLADKQERLKNVVDIEIIHKSLEV